jgi:hypothetical protein
VGIIVKITILIFSIYSAGLYGQMNIIKNVPDYSQPPALTLPSTIDSNYCAPFAFLNIVGYWELVRAHPNAMGMMAGLPPEVAAEYIGWFMDTNNQGSSVRQNAGALGTLAVDQLEGISDFVIFDQNNPLLFPWTIPPAKIANSWDIQFFMPDDFPEFQREINDGFPVKLDFLFWNILATGDTLFDPGPPIDTILIYRWGSLQSNTSFDPEAPWEEWNLEVGELGIGHAVTGIGYIVDTLNFAIVHDNWANTPLNIAIPWNHPVLPMQMVTYMIFIHVPPATILENARTRGPEYFNLLQNYPILRPCFLVHTL